MSATGVKARMAATFDRLLEKKLGMETKSLPFSSELNDLIQGPFWNASTAETNHNISSKSRLFFKFLASMAKGFIWLIVFAHPRRLRQIKLDHECVFFGYADMGLEEPLVKYWGGLPHALREPGETRHCFLVADSYLTGRRDGNPGFVLRSELVTPRVWLVALRKYISFATLNVITSMIRLLPRQGSTEKMDYFRFVTGVGAAESIIFRQSLIASMRSTSMPRTVIFLLEGYAWEQVLIGFCRKHDIVSMGFIHTLISPCQVNFKRLFGPDRELTEPDLYLTSGPLVRNTLRELGIPTARMRHVESLRFTSTSDDDGSTGLLDERSVDIFTWTCPSRALEMVNSLLPLFSEKRIDTVRLRAHPDLPSSTRKELEETILSSGMYFTSRQGVPVSDAASSAWVDLLARFDNVLVWEEPGTDCFPISHEQAKLFLLEITQEAGLKRVRARADSSGRMALGKMFTLSSDFVLWEKCLASVEA